MYFCDSHGKIIQIMQVDVFHSKQCFFRREREILRRKHVFLWLFSFWYTVRVMLFIQKDAFFEENEQFCVENMYFCAFLTSDTPSEWCFSSHNIASTSRQHRINIASTSHQHRINIALCLVAGARTEVLEEVQLVITSGAVCIDVPWVWHLQILAATSNFQASYFNFQRSAFKV